MLGKKILFIWIRYKINNPKSITEAEMLLQ